MSGDPDDVFGSLSDYVIDNLLDAAVALAAADDGSAVQWVKASDELADCARAYARAQYEQPAMTDDDYRAWLQRFTDAMGEADR